jgi:Bacteriocin class II with double-glycine leader peptide
MSTRITGTVALNDAALEAVNGGYDVLQQLSNIGNSAVDGAKTGAKIGIHGGPVFAFGGIGAGAIAGGLNGVKNAVGDGVNEAITGLKNLLN